MKTKEIIKIEKEIYIDTEKLFDEFSSTYSVNAGLGKAINDELMDFLLFNKAVNKLINNIKEQLK